MFIGETCGFKLCKWNFVLLIFTIPGIQRENTNTVYSVDLQMPFGDKYLHELQVKKHACGWKESPIFMLSLSLLIWLSQGNSSEHLAGQPCPGTRTKATQGAEKGGHCFALLCVFIWRGEPDGVFILGHGAVDTGLLGKDPSPSIQFPWMASASI